MLLIILFTLDPQLLFQSLLHSAWPQHSCLSEENIAQKMDFLDFYLPVLCIACGLLPPLAIAFVVDVFQAADMLQVVVPLLFLMVMLFI